MPKITIEYGINGLIIIRVLLTALELEISYPHGLLTDSQGNPNKLYIPCYDL